MRKLNKDHGKEKQMSGEKVSPAEILAKAVEKYGFELPQGLSIERARAVFTRENIATLGRFNQLSSPGKLRVKTEKLEYFYTSLTKVP